MARLKDSNTNAKVVHRRKISAVGRQNQLLAPLNKLIGSQNKLIWPDNKVILPGNKLIGA
jgi:hypothetical protein